MPNKKILVVEDDTQSLNLISLVLRREGYQVIECLDSRKALDVARAELPDLILCDLMMPQLDGNEVTRLLRGDTLTRTIPIIMFSARTLIEDKVAGFEAGVDDYLTKPVHPIELTTRIKAFLDDLQQEQET